jgi:putative DNA primase/helicase
MPSTFPKTVREAAEQYDAAGWRLALLHPRSKACVRDDWRKKPAAVSEFIDGYNIGIQSTGGDVDVDCDCAEAVAIAERFLPKTKARYGRKTRPNSHWLFHCPGIKKPLTFKDLITGKTIVEIRVNHQSMAPPSVHPEGEAVEWAPDAEFSALATDEEFLLRTVRLLATSAFVAMHYNPPHARHDWGLALAGLLKRFGLLEAETRNVLGAAAKFVQDGEVKDRLDAVRSTYAAGDEMPTTGGGKLIELTSKEFVETLHKIWGTESGLVLNPDDPLPSAREFVTREHTAEGVVCLKHQSGVFYAYTAEAGAYLERDEPAIRARLYAFLEGAKRPGKEGFTNFQPTSKKVDNVLDALRALCNLPESVKAPSWLRDGAKVRALDMLAYPHGMLHIPTRERCKTTPHLFTLNSLDFAYDAEAPQPTQWFSFLKTLWPDEEDADSIDTLQEIFGYCLTPDTRFQKMFMVIGPPRSGKGITARILQCLVGSRNTCSPTLSAFARDFGEQVLIGKTLAIISDARAGSRTDTSAVAETLLAVSGEDGRTVTRKYLPDWTGKLSARFVILTNELPRIKDVSGALPSRFIILALKESFLGKEDLGLFERLVPELPGILKWALEGRDRLYERKYFRQPKSGEELAREFQNLSGDEGAFLRQCTTKDDTAQVSQPDLFQAWKEWCEENGINHPGTTQTFGKGVRAVFPRLTVRRVGPRGSQVAFWVGLRLDVPLKTQDRGGM